MVEDADAKGMITFKDAMAKYVSKWTADNKNQIFEELRAEYPKRTQHLILIGSPYRSDSTGGSATYHNKETEMDDSASESSREASFDVDQFGEYDQDRAMTSVSAVFDSTKEQKKHAEEDFEAFQTDFESLLKNHPDSEIKKHQMFLHEEEYKESGSKKPLMTMLEQISQEAKDDGSVLIEIYFTGHGELKTGNWVMEKPEQITDATFDYTCELREIVEALTKNGYDKKLNITNDCCYSGGWCHAAKKLVDEKKVPLSTFSVFGTTSSERKARWGAYRRLIERCGTEYTSPQDRKRYKQIYSNKYGFASYMSQP